MQVYTKDKDGNSFLNSKLYSSIRNNTTIKKFDLHNLQMLVEKSSMSYTHSKYFINIDYNSLLSIKELIPSNYRDVDRIFYIGKKDKKPQLTMKECLYNLDNRGLSDHYSLETSFYI
jgi:hypothetical protein